jgi:hypothetical protein
MNEIQEAGGHGRNESGIADGLHIERQSLCDIVHGDYTALGSSERKTMGGNAFCP